MRYQSVSQDEISQSHLRLDGYYYSYKRIPEIDSLNPPKVDIPELYPAHLSIYMFSKEGKAVYRGIRAEMWQIPNSSKDDSYIFDVLFGLLGWEKSDLLESYKENESYILNGQSFSLTSYHKKKIYRYTRACKILDNNKIIIDQDTFKFKKHYANYNTLLGD